jgi:hypothetical protein
MQMVIERTDIGDILEFAIEVLVQRERQSKSFKNRQLGHFLVLFLLQ